MGQPTQQCPGAALATGKSDPEGETLGSNQGFEEEEGGALKLKGEETRRLQWFLEDGADGGREQEEMRDLRERQDQQRNGEPGGH
ncbi:hypothetical protein NDU88_006888 [Pleurodeles waltl]|uniref:Uncharacterized protein n=1 Tax=Pleurodeles waltl TaxID=8319 RepID=A0AAV7UQD8_PLEWA|nr:hypothetical protein NDU88_006888 [Pleurodeles waltl]